MHIDSIVDPWALQVATESGLVRVRPHPNLPFDIYNYTDLAQIGRNWTHVTRACRGLIVNRDTGQVLARPFRKFFNHGEESGFNYDLSGPVCVTDKMDGSLGIMYPAAGKPAIATRGSFESDQAIHATLKLEEKYPDFRPPVGKTLLFEIIYPQNRIVVDYAGQDDLVLLGMVDIATGLTYGPQAVPDWPGPRTEVFEYQTLREALGAPDRPNREGLVVHFVDSDNRIKLKQADYVALHKIVFGLNERVVWEHLRSGWGRHRSTALIDELAKDLPEEFEAWIHGVASRLVDEYFDRDLTVWSRFEELQMDKLTGLGKRKEFALAIKDEPGWLKSCLFLSLDGKDPAGVIWKLLEPKADKTPHTKEGR